MGQRWIFNRVIRIKFGTPLLWRLVLANIDLVQPGIDVGGAGAGQKVCKPIAYFNLAGKKTNLRKPVVGEWFEAMRIESTQQVLPAGGKMGIQIAPDGVVQQFFLPALVVMVLNRYLPEMSG